MGAALDGVLTVHKRVVLLARLIRMGERNLYIFSFQVDNRIERVGTHVLRQQVEQAVLRSVLTPVVEQGETRIQIRIVAHHLLDIIVAEMVVLKQPLAVVRRELNQRAALLAAVIVHHPRVAHQMPLMEDRLARLALAERLHGEVHRQGIHRFRTHAVQSHGLLERLGVVLAAGVQQRHCIHHLPQGYAAPIVAHAHLLIAHGNLYHLAFAHAILIDGVIDGLFDKHIDTVIGVAAVA